MTTSNLPPLLNHFLAGWSCSTASASSPKNSLVRMVTAANSSLPNISVENGTSACASSDALYQTDNGSSFAMIGQPQWTEEHFASTAREEGHGAALTLAYAEYGSRFLQAVQGRFAFAVIDTSADTVMLGTDRMGRYPLYYAEIDDGLVFGSSASIVLADTTPTDEAAQATLQAQGLYDYVYFHMVPSPHSIFAGLKKLPAGHLLLCSENQCVVSNYFRPVFREQSQDSFTSLGAELKTQLKSAVEHCIEPDVTVGAFLSGGLDSSSVAGMLAEICPNNAHAFSIGFSAKGYDEMAYARLTAKHFGIQLHEYYVTPEDVVKALPMVAASYDEPFGNSSALPAYFCAKLAAENGIQCLLAGDGGDELFGGNERYIKQRVFENYQKFPAGLRHTFIEPLINALPNAIPLASKAKSYLQQANIPLPDRLQSYNFLHRHAANDIFNDEFLATVDTRAPLQLLRETYHRATDASTLNKMLYLDWQYTLADNDLRKVSHMCELAGVDVAYPMLDDGLIDLSCRVPSDWKIKGNDLRHFYKAALKGWLHHDTINKKKQGFGLPFGVWMETHKPLQEMAYDHLLNLKKRQFFKPAFIDQTIDLHRNQHAAYYGELIWILMVLEMWLAKRQ